MEVYQRLVDGFDKHLRQRIKKEINNYELFSKIERIMRHITEVPKDLLNKLPEKPVIKKSRVGMFRKYLNNGNELIFRKKQFRKKKLSKTIVKGILQYYNKSSNDENNMFWDYLIDYLCELTGRSYYEIDFHYADEHKFTYSSQFT